MDKPEPWADERYQIETPERVDLEYEVAGLGSRFVAALVDSTIIGFVATLVWVFGFLGLALIEGLLLLIEDSDPGDGDYYAAMAVSTFLTFVVIWGYYVLFEMIWQGQSPGKRWLGLRVIKDGGYPIRFVDSTVRNVVRLVDFLPFYYIVGAIVMMLNRRYRRLGDLAAGTVVVKERRDVRLESLWSSRPSPAVAPVVRKEGWQPSADSPPSEGHVAGAQRTIPNVERLTADDQSLVREYLLRRSTLVPSAAVRLSSTLATRLAQKLDYDLGGEAPDDFLARLHQQIRRSGEPPTAL